MLMGDGTHCQNILVMWSTFMEGVNVNEFSSPNYHGDATCNNALAIENAKSTVAGYRNN